MASGLTLIFGVMRVINIAHGAFITSLTTHTIPGVTPYKPHPIVFSSANEPDPSYPNIFFPAGLVTVTPGEAVDYAFVRAAVLADAERFRLIDLNVDRLFQGQQLAQELTEEGLKVLAHLYTEDSRYRDAFHVMRTALLAHPNSDMTRKIQDEAAITFESLFLGGKGDALTPVEALGLFYDFRELTPIGRRGDEMIRRLSDRLVSLDLLDQAGRF